MKHGSHSKHPNENVHEKRPSMEYFHYHEQVDDDEQHQPRGGRRKSKDSRKTSQEQVSAAPSSSTYYSMGSQESDRAAGVTRTRGASPPPCSSSGQSDARKRRDRFDNRVLFELSSGSEMASAAHSKNTSIAESPSRMRPSGDSQVFHDPESFREESEEQTWQSRRAVLRAHEFSSPTHKPSISTSTTATGPNSRRYARRRRPHHPHHHHSNGDIRELRSPTSSASLSTITSPTAYMRSQASSPVGPPQPSSFFDENFIPLKLLGRGVSGVVLLARHRITGLLYAIKVISVTTKQGEEDVLREVRLYAKLSANSGMNTTEVDADGNPLDAQLASAITEELGVRSTSAAASESEWENLYTDSASTASTHTPKTPEDSHHEFFDTAQPQKERRESLLCEMQKRRKRTMEAHISAPSPLGADGIVRYYNSWTETIGEKRAYQLSLIGMHNAGSGKAVPFRQRLKMPFPSAAFSVRNPANMPSAAFPFAPHQHQHQHHQQSHSPLGHMHDSGSALRAGGLLGPSRPVGAPAPSLVNDLLTLFHVTGCAFSSSDAACGRNSPLAICGPSSTPSHSNDAPEAMNVSHRRRFESERVLTSDESQLAGMQLPTLTQLLLFLRTLPADVVERIPQDVLMRVFNAVTQNGGTSSAVGVQAAASHADPHASRVERRSRGKLRSIAGSQVDQRRALPPPSLYTCSKSKWSNPRAMKGHPSLCTRVPSDLLTWGQLDLNQALEDEHKGSQQLLLGDDDVDDEDDEEDDDHRSDNTTDESATTFAAGDGNSTGTSEDSSDGDDDDDSHSSSPRWWASTSDSEKNYHASNASAKTEQTIPGVQRGVRSNPAETVAERRPSLRQQFSPTQRSVGFPLKVRHASCIDDDDGAHDTIHWKSRSATESTSSSSSSSSSSVATESLAEGSEQESSSVVPSHTFSGGTDESEESGHTDEEEEERRAVSYRVGSSAHTPYGAMIGSKVMFIQMEYFHTTLVKELSTRQTMDRIWNLIVGIKLFDALSFLHRHGIVHRDVKPSNILLDYRCQLNTATMRLPPWSDVEDAGTHGGFTTTTTTTSTTTTTPSTATTTGSGAYHSFDSTESPPASTESASNTLFMRNGRAFLYSIPQLFSLPKNKFIHSARSMEKALLRYFVHLGLADFGLAKSLTNQGGTHAAAAAASYFCSTSINTEGVGSPLYSSPEQLQGRALTPASDVFSAGVVFAELYIQPTTVAERIDVLSKVRQYGVPQSATSTLRGPPTTMYFSRLCEELRTCYPELSIVEEMVRADASQRTDLYKAREVLATTLCDVMKAERRVANQSAN